MVVAHEEENVRVRFRGPEEERREQEESEREAVLHREGF